MSTFALLPGRRPALVCMALAALSGCTLPTLAPALRAGDAAAAPADWQAQLQRWRGVPVLLLGEQHDAPAHQQWEQQTVQWLAARGRLAALVLEMAETGAATDGLPPRADAAQVRAALRWNDAAWPWERYAGVVMAAVAAGVPVRGGNLDAAGLRAAMQDEALDHHLPPAALARQRAAIEQGHCGLLPAARVQPLVRAQLARDASLALALRLALAPGATAVLLAGHGHVQRSMGVPTWLGQDLEQKTAIAQAGQAPAAIKNEADFIHATPALPPEDYCTGLRARWPSVPAPR